MSECKYWNEEHHECAERYNDFMEAEIRADERAKFLEIVKEAKEDCLHHFQDINIYYNDCRMKDELEGFWDEVIEELKEQGNV